MKRGVVFSVSEDLIEIRSLLDTLGVRVEKEYVQSKKAPHNTSYLGPGKVNEIFDEIKDMEYDFIVINGTLKPSQHHFLEMKFQHEVLDRTGVIMRIFTEHAHTPEAILQVTLAKLRYEQPFLREWIHDSKSGDRPGFLSGGAYVTDVYYEHAKTHAKRIETDLAELSAQRALRRKRRRDGGYVLVSVAGYTNAGKTALMNSLSDSSLEVDGRLFSTLSTTTRRIKGIRGSALISDTVGFISDLPTGLVDAFKSTLEEVYQADVILLVFDSSEDIDSIRRKLSTSLDIVLPMIEESRLVFVGNKADLIDGPRESKLRNELEDVVAGRDLLFVSAVEGRGLDQIRSKVSEAQRRSAVIRVNLPDTDAAHSLISRLYGQTDISSTVTDRGMTVTLACLPSDVDKLVAWLKAAGGTRLTVEKPNGDASS